MTFLSLAYCHYFSSSSDLISLLYLLSDADSDCFGELVCYFRNAYETVPGCSGQGGRGEDYCYHPMRHGVDGDSNMIPRITRSPTQAPTTPKPTPRPTLRARPNEPEQPRDYALNDDKESSEELGISVNRAHTDPFEDGENPIGGEGAGVADTKSTMFEVVRNHNCFLGQCDLCEGSCRHDSDCADGLFCIKRDEFGDDVVDNLADCSGEAQRRVNYCYHSRPYTELMIVPDAGANCGKGVICTACQGDCGECRIHCLFSLYICPNSSLVRLTSYFLHMFLF